MTVKLSIELPEALERPAREKGLLQPERVAQLIEREVAQDQARQDFRRMLKQLHLVNDQPMALDEIQAVVADVRARRRHPNPSPGLLSPR